MERQGVEYWLLKKTIKEEKARADAEIEEYQQRQWKAYHTSNKEFAKCENRVSRHDGSCASRSRNL